MRLYTSVLLTCGVLGLTANTALAAPLSGVVYDGTTMEPIEGAVVENGDASATTDAAGVYKIDDLPVGALTVKVSAEGYEPIEENIDLPAEGLTDQVFILVTPGAAGEIIEITEKAPAVPEPPGRQDLGRAELTRIPGTRGDALTSIKSLPGVANADAPGSGPGLLVIRGSAPEDSKISIDGIEVPLLYHFFGLQSIVPSEFLESIDFMPGGFGANEGRSTGGVIDIRTRDEVIDQTTGFAEMSFINLAAFVQGPISRRHGLQFAAGVRRSTIDFILPAAIPDDVNLSFTTAPQYYDAQLRVDWRANERNRVSTLGLLSFDLLTLISENIDPNEPLLTGKFDNETSFTRLITTWRYSGDGIESKLTTAAGTTGLRFEIGAERYFILDARRVEAREDFRWEAHRRFQVRAGAEGRLAEADIVARIPAPPSEGEGGVPNFSTSPVIEIDRSVDSNVAGAYAIVDFKPTDKTTISPGVRLDYFDHIGEVTLTPRINVRHRIDDRWETHLAVGAYSRPPLQIESLPTSVDPELATQYVLGGEYRVAEGIKATASAFYTDRRQLIVRDEMLAATDPIEAYVNRGYGRSFGAETLVRVKRRNFFGWLAYSLSRSDRVDDPMSDRRLFDFDQTHNVILVGSYQWGKWTFGGRWQFSTGTPVTPVIGTVFQSDFNVHLPVLGDINSDRLDPAHQLDVRVDRKWTFQHWALSAYLDITNVYANPRTLGFRYNFDYSEREAIQELPIFPAIGVRGSF